MTDQEARLYFIAARDDPFLASWISVLDSNKLTPTTQITGYDWWDAFQEFYNLDLVTQETFHCINVEKTFFGKSYPKGRAIQDALQNLRILRATASGNDLSEGIRTAKGEHTMSAKPPMELFENPAALTARPSSAPMMQEDPRPQITPFAPAGRLPTKLDLFEAPSVSAPPPMTVLSPTVRHGLDARPQVDSLPCTNVEMGHKPDPRPYVGEFEQTYELRCCGRVVDCDQDDGDLHDTGDQDDHMIMELVFHGECPTCKKTFHVSVAAPVSRDAAQL